MYFQKSFTRFTELLNISRFNVSKFRKMAKSSFEYVKEFELEDKLLPNCWLVIRLDGKCFHRFADDHEFNKPNDSRALDLMNFAALSVLDEFHDIIMAYGQSDEYSFIMKKNANLYNRRESKILTTITSKFTSSYVFHWSKFFNQVSLKYPPAFDGRIVLYPTDKNLTDYLSWRQADVHINNLYNTTFWNLILKGNMTPVQAEKKLSGTISGEKNEILFSEFNINYNDEPVMFKRGTILLRKEVIDDASNKYRKVIIKSHDDMIKEKFWKTHSEILSMGPPAKYDINQEHNEFVREQLEKRRKNLIN